MDGDEGSGGVSLGFEEREAVAAAAFVGAVDDVVVGDGCGARVSIGFESDDRHVAEVLHLFGGEVAFDGNG